MKQRPPEFFSPDDGASGGRPAAAVDALGGAIDRVVAVEARINALYGERAVALAAAEQLSRKCDLSAPDAPLARRHDPEVTRRAFVADVATALHVPEGTVQRLLAESAQLVEVLADTSSALCTGAMSYRNAQALAAETGGLDDDAARHLETVVLAKASVSTPAGFRRLLRRERERVHPESITARCRREAADRFLSLDGCRDGMGLLSAYLPIADAQAVFNRVTALGISLQCPDESRTLAQLRADVFRDLALATGAGSPGIVATVHVTVPALTLLGHDAGPAVLEGYGPIGLDVAKELAGGAKSWYRILTHPETGAILSYGTDRYRPPADLARVVKLRDGSCRYPGCERPAEFCDIDHTIARADEGETDRRNLAALCARHHALKHESTWTVSQSADGSGRLTWVSPTGRIHETEPSGPSQPAPAATDSPDPVAIADPDVDPPPPF